MNVKAQVVINGSLAATWAAITDIENSPRTIKGIERIEMVHKPANGLVGLKWNETRMLFGDAATVEKWISDAAEQEFYQTTAETQGFRYVCTKTITESGGMILLTETHESKPQSLGAKLMSVPMGLLFKGVARKAILQDLNDIKAAVEQECSTTAE